VKDSALLVPAFVVTVVSRERFCVVELTRNVAVMLVELTTTTLLTVTAPPCTVTLAGLVKFVPVSVTVTVEPRRAAFGETEVSVGFPTTGALTVNVCAPLFPLTVVTVTLWAPVPAVAAMVNVAVICDALTTTMLLAVTPVPPIATVAPDWKFEPFSVTATFIPCVPLFGVIELRTGTADATVTIAVPTAVDDTVLVAWIVAVPPVGGTAGAV
jgi:hypothetical protein